MGIAYHCRKLLALVIFKAHNCWSTKMHLLYINFHLPYVNARNTCTCISERLVLIVALHCLHMNIEGTKIMWFVHKLWWITITPLCDILCLWVFLYIYRLLHYFLCPKKAWVWLKCKTKLYSILQMIYSFEQSNWFSLHVGSSVISCLTWRNNALLPLTLNFCIKSPVLFQPC